MFDANPMPRECSVCATCSRSEWQVLDAEGERRLTEMRRTSVYDEGETIYHQSDNARGIYCIETGKVLLRQFDSFGNETDFRISLGNETLGWRSFFAEQPHAATAVALTPCRICYVAGGPLRELVRDYPGLAMGFLKTVARDRGPREGLLLRSPLLPARVRVINMMLILARQLGKDEADGGASLLLPISRHQIAAMVGIRGETLSRTLASLAEEGMFEINGRNVRIADVGRMIREVNFDLPS